MSIRLPQRINEAPVGHDPSSFDGSTLRPLEGPAAAEYITPAVNSRVIAATAKTIAARLDIGRGPTSGGEVPVASAAEQADLVRADPRLSQRDRQNGDGDQHTDCQEALNVFDRGDRRPPDQDAEPGENAHVDHDGGDETGDECPAGHGDHAGHLAGVNPQSRDEAADEDPEPP